MPVSAETPTPIQVKKHGTRTRLASPRLSVVMPVFNEMATIDEIVPRVLGLPLAVELIVVDDCSTDGTRQRLESLQREYGFTLLLEERNQGKGAASGAGSPRSPATWWPFRTPTSNTHPKNCQNWPR